MGKGFSLHPFYTLNCFKQSARYFLISESVPGINFRLRWVRCLNGFVSITFNVQVVRSPFKEPWEIKWRMNLQGENKNKWWMSSNTCKSLKSIFKKNQVHHSLRWKMLMCSYTHYWNVMSQSHIHSMTVYQLNWRCFFFHFIISCPSIKPSLAKVTLLRFYKEIKVNRKAMHVINIVPIYHWLMPTMDCMHGNICPGFTFAPFAFVVSRQF